MLGRTNDGLGLASGGALWFSDLTAADPYYVLPISCGASFYLMASIDPSGAPFDPKACRNPDCGGREFDTDWRQGDRICRSCGTVQNNRSVENQEAEYRVFADDEKSGNKEHYSQVNGRGGGSVSLSGCVSFALSLRSSRATAPASVRCEITSSARRRWSSEYM